LEGVLRQTVLQTTGSVITADFLPSSITNDLAPIDAEYASQADFESDVPRSDLKQFVRERLNAKSSNVYAETLEMMERYLLSRILTLADGNQSEAARILGITRGSLRHKIRCLGIVIESTVDPGV
jgi:two-component system nitrogen regulation response regulator GlnG